MKTRRSFLKRLAAAVAIIAIAPEIAFRAKLKVSEAPNSPFWFVTSRWSQTECRSKEYEELMQTLFASNAKPSTEIEMWISGTPEEKLETKRAILMAGERYYGKALHVR